MREYFEVLRRCRLFDGITDEDLSAMLGCLKAEIRKYRKNSTLIAEGGKVSDIGVLLSGTVQLVRMDYYGNRSIVANIEPSRLFCESFVCAEVSAIPVSVIAAEDCAVLFINGRRILQSCSSACEFHNKMIFNLMKVVAEKNLTFHRKIEITSKRTTREKLMTYLLGQAKEHGDNCFTIPFDRQALADFLEVDRSGLSAEISKLRKEGVIACRRSTFQLL